MTHFVNESSIDITSRWRINNSVMLLIPYPSHLCVLRRIYCSFQNRSGYTFGSRVNGITFKLLGFHRFCQTFFIGAKGTLISQQRAIVN